MAPASYFGPGPGNTEAMGRWENNRILHMANAHCLLLLVVLNFAGISAIFVPSPTVVREKLLASVAPKKSEKSHED